MSQICKNCVYYDPESTFSGKCTLDDTAVLNTELCGEWKEISQPK